jgi:carbonic anhydrase
LHAPRHYFESAAIVRDDGQSFERVGNFTILELVEAATFNVWNYNGSLTTPGCDESVIWMVSQAILPIDQSELNLLSRIRDDEGKIITRCNRPVQPLNGRRIVAIH